MTFEYLEIICNCLGAAGLMHRVEVGLPGTRCPHAINDKNCLKNIYPAVDLSVVCPTRCSAVPATLNSSAQFDVQGSPVVGTRGATSAR